MFSREVVAVRIPGALECIGIARSAVDAVGERMQLSPRARAEVKLAVGEACNNAVLHAKGAGLLAGSIQVTCRLKDDALEIDVANPGNGFHPAAHAGMPDAEILAEHGRGLALMEMLMDAVEYLSEDGNTIVRLRKLRPCQKSGIDPDQGRVTAPAPEPVPRYGRQPLRGRTRRTGSAAPGRLLKELPL